MFRTLLALCSSSLLALFLAGCGSGEPAAPAAHASESPAGEKAAASDAPAAPTDPMESIHAFLQAKPIDKSAADWKMKLPLPPRLTFDGAHRYFWLLNTSEGPLEIRLMPEVAPMHVSSTIYLTELGFYDGLTFHRVIPGFMAQGGDPLGIGKGGPGYRYAGEFSPDVRHSKAGMLSMANSGPGTDGSQFFLTFKETPGLDDKHSIFGELVEGMDTLRKLEQAGSKTGQTSKKLTIETARIRVE